MNRLIVIILLLGSCTAPGRFISYTAKTIPVYPVVPIPQKFILLNNYNIEAKKFRDKKEILFISIVDSLLTSIANSIQNETGIATTVIPGFTTLSGNRDSLLKNLLLKEQASHAIVLQLFDVYFYQKEVEVTKNSDGSKHREAFYDIVSEVSYDLCTSDTVLLTINEQIKRYHSSRSVVSGLLAAGPDIVSQQKAAYQISMENGGKYLNHFFPGEAVRNRILFTGKGFEAVNLALTKDNYETAFIECMRLCNSTDKKIAAMANYNCAVLAERNNQPAEAKRYLWQSLSLAELPEARRMWADFE